MGRHTAPVPFDAHPVTGPVTVVSPTTDPRLFDAPLPAARAVEAQVPPAPAPIPAPRFLTQTDRRQQDRRPAPNAPIGYAAAPVLRHMPTVVPAPAVAPATMAMPVFGATAPRSAARPAPRPAAPGLLAPRYSAASLTTGPVQLPAFDIDFDIVDEPESPPAFGRGRTVKLAACAVAVLGAVSGAALLLPGQSAPASAAETNGCQPTKVMPKPTSRLTAEQRRALHKAHHHRRSVAPVASPLASTSATATPAPTASNTATPTPSASATPFDTPSSSAPTESAGSGVLPGLVSSAIRTVVSSASGVVDLVNGTYSFSDFDQYLLGINLKGKDLVGDGVDKTVIRMAPHSSSKSGNVPTASGTTNQLYMLQAVGTKKLSDFTLIGTEQGHLYNGIRLGQTSGFRGSNIKVEAVPGDDHLPPGETFGINDWRTTGSVWSNVEVDGGGVGAAGFGANSSSDITVKDSYFHNNPSSLGATFWQTKNVTIVDSTSSNNRGGFNFERVSGTVDIVRPVLKNNSSSDISVGSDQASAKITITDPVLEPGKKLRIRIFNGYGAGANKQQKSDIHVIVNGVDKTSSLVQWL